MRKKYRNIVIDGEEWAWNCTKRDNYYRYSTIKIWRDKKTVYEKSFGGERDNEKHYSITPGLIARFIKMFLK